jgi:hypothetical protein
MNIEPFYLQRSISKYKRKDYFQIQRKGLCPRGKVGSKYKGRCPHVDNRLVDTVLVYVLVYVLEAHPS